MQDKYIVTKKTNGPNALSINPFTFQRISDVISGIFKTGNAGVGARGVAKGVWDFALQGGAISSINLLPGDQLIPTNAIITNVIIDTVTALTSAGSPVIGLEAESSADLKANNTAMATYTGLIGGIPVPQTASTWIKTTANRNIVMNIGTAAITAGKIVVFVEYVISE